MKYDKKYRWKKLSRIIGNEETISSLEECLENDLPSCMLFVGPSGTGKTTVARIIATATKFEVNEHNISNQRGIDDARSIIDDIQYGSLTESGKVIILNECHEANSHFWNAMLESLEEPPPNVHFILCTTDPLKIKIKAVKTRKWLFKFNKLNSEEMNKLLQRIIKKEKLKIKQIVQTRLIQAANGTPRELLIMLDQIKSQNEKTALRIINDYESYEGESEEVIQLCRDLLKGVTYNQIVKSIKDIKEDPETIRNIVCSYMGKVLQSKLNKRALLILDCFGEPYYTYPNTSGLLRSIALIYTE